jgi:uncharacterized zinc-type alcohol dehydrogenase-like protein
VTKYAVGDRVGVGCFVDSCRTCEQCLAGLEQFCTNGGMTGTYNDKYRDGEVTQGGYSTHIVVDENYVLRIPDGLSLDVAAPLLCAGITLYSPLTHWNAGPGKKVAIVGVGGLGHMGIKIAHAKGAEVTALSQSMRKKEDASRLGADHYYATGDPETFTKLAGTFDLIVSTVSAVVDLDAYLSLLKPDGVLANVGAPENPSSLRLFSLIMGRIADRRHQGDPGDAGLLRGARLGCRHRGHQRRSDQRGVRSRRRQRRPLPLRHRHRFPA